MSIFDNIKDFYDNFDGEKGVIGFSALNKPIYYLAVKKSPRPIVIVQYAMHAREHITAHLALYQIRRFINGIKAGIDAGLNMPLETPVEAPVETNESAE